MGTCISKSSTFRKTGSGLDCIPTEKALEKAERVKRLHALKSIHQPSSTVPVLQPACDNALFKRRRLNSSADSISTRESV